MIKTPEWSGWKNMPLRKPLPLGIVIYTCFLLMCYMIKGADVPANMMYILFALNGISMSGYYGTSAFEHKIDNAAASLLPPPPPPAMQEPPEPPDGQEQQP